MRLSIRRIMLFACATALAAAFAVTLQQPARAAGGAPPPVPTGLEVPEGSRLFLVGHASGTQNYICLPSGTGVKFALFTPQATLFSDGDQVTTHFFSPNPSGDGRIFATWQHSRDTSAFWGEVKDKDDSSDDPKFVARGAIPWLLLTKVETQAGPDGGDKLANTTFIQRLNTAGGVAPSEGCSSSADVGNKAFVPYTADYFFYR